MHKVNSEAILKKVNEWKSMPEMVPAVYRLFVFLDWKDIPKEYQDNYDTRAKDIWDDDIDLLWDRIEIDTEITVKAVFDELLKRNVVAAFGITPIILADVFVRGYKTGKWQGKMMSIVNNYKNYVAYDRQTAELDTLLRMGSFIEELCRKTKITLTFDLVNVIEKITTEYLKYDNNEDYSNKEFETNIDEAIEVFEIAKDVENSK